MILYDAYNGNYRLPQPPQPPPHHDEPLPQNPLPHLLGATLFVWIALLIAIKDATLSHLPLLLSYRFFDDVCKRSSIRVSNLVSKPNNTAR